MYPSAPGRWIIDPWLERGLSVDPHLAEKHLANVLSNLQHGQNEHSTWVKASLFGAMIIGGKLAMRPDLEVLELLKRYPGRLKLLMLHTEEFIDAQSSPSEELLEHLAHLRSRVNQEIDEEWQDINVSGDFAGVNRRDMARDVGLETEYRLLFQPLSDATHGDWSTIQGSIMQRCLNPLHRWHWIARREEPRALRADLVDVLLDQLDAMVVAFEEAKSSRASSPSS